MVEIAACEDCGRECDRADMRHNIVDDTLHCEPCIQASMRELMRQIVEADSGIPTRTKVGCDG